MARRQLGHGRGGRMKIETDAAEIRAGMRHGRTLGSPIAVLVANRDYANWEERMNPWPVEGFEPDEVHLPRPGHADLVGVRSTGTPTSATCSSGPAPARPPPASPPARLPAASSPRSASASTATSPRSPRCRAPERPDLGAEDFAGVDEDPVRCLDPETSAAMVEQINRLRKANECLGGSFEVRAFGLVPGLGSHISWEERLDGLLAGAISSIQSVKGVGDRRSLGRRRAARLGGPRRDLLVSRSAATTARPTTRAGSRAG